MKKMKKTIYCKLQRFTQIFYLSSAMVWFFAKIILGNEYKYVLLPMKIFLNICILLTILKIIKESKVL